MTFQWPYVLLALPLALAGLLVLFALTQRARSRMLERFAAARLLPTLLVSYSPALRLTKQILITAGVLLALAALARPQWGYDWQENRTRGVDVVFVLDTSRSMLTPDVQPNRLERAKLAIYDCLQKMPGNRVGLVAFAGDAFLQCPLTQDYDAFRQTLDAVDTNTISRGGTDIAVGLDAAATALEKSGNHKIIVLITDGEDLEGQGVSEAKTLADQGITIYTVGVGTAQGEIIPVRDTSGKTNFVRDERGELVKSHLDSTTLSDIANVTHGFYQPLGPTGEGLMRVYEDGIKKLPDQEQKSKMTRQPIERFQWPLAAGLLLLMLELLVGTRRPAWLRRNMPVTVLTEPPPLVSVKPTSTQKNFGPAKSSSVPVGAILLALALGATTRTQAATASDATQPTPAPAPTVAPQTSSAKTAQSLFEKGDYSAAAEVYGKAADAAPDDGRFRYNQGESLYRSKDYEGSAQAFTKSLSSSDLALQQRSYYNLGNAHYRLGQEQKKEDPKKTLETWDAAVKDYQNALDLEPHDADAHYNLELVKKQIAELKKQQDQQQKNQQQNQQKPDDSKQDQKDQSDQKDQQQNQQNSSSDQKNKSDQQKPDSQNQPNQNGQSPDNSSSKPSDQKNQPDQKNGSGNQPNSPAQKPGDQNSPDKKDGDQSKPDQANSPNGKNGDQKQPQNSSGQQPKPSSGSGQKPANSQPSSSSHPQKNGAQPQPAKSSGSGTGKEPNAQKSGQQPAGASSAGGQQPSTANAGEAGANGTMAIGVMSRDEAMQLLNSLKPAERKLPAARLQQNNPNPSSSDQDHKDW